MKIQMKRPFMRLKRMAHITFQKNQQENCLQNYKKGSFEQEKDLILKYMKKNGRGM